MCCTRMTFTHLVVIILSMNAVIRDCVAQLCDEGDDPDGMLARAFSMSCEDAISQTDCDFDMHALGAPVGTFVSVLCPVSCGTCMSCADDPDGFLAWIVDSRWDVSCAELAASVGCSTDLHSLAPPDPSACDEDPDGMLASQGMTCADVIGMGCDFDMHAMGAPEGTLISLLCPVSCDDCPAPPPPPGWAVPEGTQISLLCPGTCELIGQGSCPPELPDAPAFISNAPECIDTLHIILASFGGTCDMMFEMFGFPCDFDMHFAWDTLFAPGSVSLPPPPTPPPLHAHKIDSVFVISTYVFFVGCRCALPERLRYVS
eukprot:SAG31_NODE_11634_length_1011_cov_1.182018_1_plen_315_part_01